MIYRLLTIFLEGHIINSYLVLIKEVLAQDFGQKFPSSAEKELEVKLELLTQITGSSILSAPANRSKLSEKSIAQKNESVDEIQMKVKEFVKKHSYDFWKFYQSGIAFSKLDQAACKKALENTFKKTIPSSYN